MGSLDERGDISVALLAIYPFIFILALILTVRHGFRRQAGWLFLLLFSTAKIVGAILHIVAELQSAPSKGLLIAAFAIEGAGLAPLLECTLSFVGAAGSRIIETHAIVTRARLRIVHLLMTGTAVMFIIGATDATSDDASERSTGSTLRKVGGILFLVAFLTIVSCIVVFWSAQHELLKYQKILLKGISCAVPFLAVRVLYSILSSFSPSSSFSSLGTSSESTSGLAKFNTITGRWQLFLIMGVLMEFFVVSIYLFFGLRLPVSEGVDYEAAQTRESATSAARLRSLAVVIIAPSHALDCLSKQKRARTSKKSNNPDRKGWVRQSTPTRERLLGVRRSGLRISFAFRGRRPSCLLNLNKCIPQPTSISTTAIEPSSSCSSSSTSSTDLKRKFTSLDTNPSSGAFERVAGADVEEASSTKKHRCTPRATECQKEETVDNSERERVVEQRTKAVKEKQRQKKKKKRQKAEKQARNEEHRQRVEETARHAETANPESRRFLVGMPLASSVSCEKHINKLKSKLKNAIVCSKLLVVTEEHFDEVIIPSVSLGNRLPRLLCQETLAAIERVLDDVQPPHELESSQNAEDKIKYLFKPILKSLSLHDTIITTGFSWREKIGLRSTIDLGIHEYGPKSDAAIIKVLNDKEAKIVVLFEAYSKLGQSLSTPDENRADRVRLLIQGSYISIRDGKPSVVYYLTRDKYVETILIFCEDQERRKVRLLLTSA
ncbi:hypothetical protein ACEPAF_3347 [Sanghuangporus sanghuang]